ncbi:hypothetical protein AB0A69_19875 [Streptomyces sp. NPDC045431]|uniref:hypothetical protein n=1 Tax=Streptomyces sp. NPDC045431 TaxID=3155613 RepID=UPI0033E3E3CA
MDGQTGALTALSGAVATEHQRTREAIQDAAASLRRDGLDGRDSRELEALDGLTGEIRALRCDVVEGLGRLADAPRPVLEGGGDGVTGEHDDHQEGTMERDEEHAEEAGPSGDGGRNGGRNDTPGKDAELKNVIEAAYRGERVPPGPAAAGPGGDGEAPPEQDVVHGVLLMKAAGVARAQLVVHQHHWEFLAGLAAHHPHFRTPHQVEDLGGGRLRVTVSGMSLIALLIKVWHTRADAEVLGAEWAVAATVYGRIADRLSGVGGPGEPITVVLDDGVAQASEDTAPPDAA